MVASVDVLKKHRFALLAILLIPALAMIVAMVLIAALGHRNILVIAVVISLLLVQYLGLVAYIWRKLIARELLKNSSL